MRQEVAKKKGSAAGKAAKAAHEKIYGKDAGVAKKAKKK